MNVLSIHVYTVVFVQLQMLIHINVFVLVQVIMVLLVNIQTVTHLDGLITQQPISTANCAGVLNNGAACIITHTADYSQGTVTCTSGSYVTVVAKAHCPVVAPTNGTIVGCPNKLIHGANCTPKCNFGYTIANQNVCNNGVLSTQATCTPNPCDATALITQGASVGTCTATLASGSECSQVCNTGYSLTTKSSCLAQVLTAGVCSPDACDATALLTNGGTAGDCTTTLASGSTCTPTCATGYTLAGTSSCFAGTLTAAACNPSSCTGHNVAIANGAVGNCLSATLAHNASCQPTCNTGFTVSGKSSCALGVLTAAVCNANSCDATNLVQFGHAVGTCTTTLASGATCQQVCKSGYTGSPSSCLNGVLTAGVCSADKCDATPLSTNAQSKGTCTTKLDHGASCDQVCKTGYTLTSGSSCFAGTLTPAVCSESSCDASQAPTNGNVGTCTAVLVSGGSCQIGCKTGYVASGTSTCAKGVLTAATCGEAPCTPKAPTNGLIGNCKATLASGSKCTPVCAEGFDLVGQTKCLKGILSPAKCKSGVLSIFIGMYLIIAAFIYV